VHLQSLHAATFATATKAKTMIMVIFSGQTE